MADEEQDGAGRRLLEDLQERVGGGAVQLVGGVDDRDAPAAVGGGELEEALERADLVDGDGGAQALGLVVPGAAAEEELRRGEGGELAEDRVVAGHVEGRARRSPATRWRAMRQASVALPTPRGPVISQAWCRRPVAAASRKRASAASWPKRTAVSRGCGAPGRRSGSSGAALMRATARGDAGRDLVGGAGGGDDAAAGGELGGEREEARAQAAWKSGPKRSKRSSALPRARPRASATLGREVEDEGEVGLDADGERVQRVDDARAGRRGRRPGRRGWNRRSGR